MMNMKRLFLELQYAVVNLSQQNMDVKQSCVIHNNIIYFKRDSLLSQWHGYLDTQSTFTLDPLTEEQPLVNNL